MYTLRGDHDPLIEAITYHSGSCTPKTAFTALKGTHTDGHEFIASAVKAGSPLIIHSKDLPAYDPETTYIQCSKPQILSAQIAYQLFAPYPENIIGITGTDGKSSTALFLYRFLKASGTAAALLSTIGIDDGSGYIPTPYRQSTPEPDVLYPFLARCRSNSIETVVLEATSHALSHQTGRLYPLTFSGGIVQNISSEHLDFHSSLERYIDDKMNLVRQIREGGFLITSASHPYFEHIKITKDDAVRMLTYSCDNEEKESTLHAATESEQIDSRSFCMTLGKEQTRGQTPFAPPFFLENIAAAALAAASHASLPLSSFIRKKVLSEGIEGRYHLMRLDDGRIIIIDFAHTPDAFEKLLSFIRSVNPDSHITAMFSAAGRRDRGKRSPLGKAAGKYCNRIYLSDEDSRDEKLSEIWCDIEKGIKESGFTGELKKITDREEAVRTAVNELKASEILLLLGKGHEKSIETADGITPWDELSLVKRIVKEKELI